MRTGIGYDSHRFVEGRPLVLAGERIPHDRGLAGHSDADAVAHAVTDAVLGAAAMGDIGSHFPADDERWRDADSMAMLRQAVQWLEDRGCAVVNVNVTVLCELPKIAPYVPAMRARLADALAVESGAVSIKGKTNEGMGWIGRGEGVAALAVATIRCH